MPPFRTVVEPVLGTRLTMRIDGRARAVAEQVESVVLDEAERLEDILSLFPPGRARSRWGRGELLDPPRELVEVLALAARWHGRTGGAFNPCLGLLMERWRRAEAEQVLPSGDELSDVAAHATIPFVVEGGRLVQTGDCRNVDVHGVAKGWVIDRLHDAGVVDAGATGVLVDLGGALRHAAGDASSLATVALEDP